jgi:hypothetical protein
MLSIDPISPPEDGGGAGFEAWSGPAHMPPVKQ